MISVDIKGLLNGDAADIPLKNGDILFIPSATEMLGERNVTIFGEVTYPGQYPYADGITIRNLILQAGGMTEAGSLAKIDVYRRVRDSKATETDSINAQTFSFSLDESYNLLQDTIFTLMPFDFVMIRKAPTYRYLQNVYVNGEVNFTGSYTLSHKDYRLSDLIKACGGLTPNANVNGARLTRKMNQQELEARKQANIKSQIELYESALKYGDEMNTHIADSLSAMKENTPNTYIVSTNLQKALDNPGSNYDIILRAGDVLNIPENTNLIHVRGEVIYPISMPYEKGKNLSYYINHAGGFSDNARKSKVYGIQENGSVVKLQANSVRDIQPGIDIIVPHKQVKRKMGKNEIIGITGSIATFGAVIAAILSIIKK
jgi:protein involved in polysaccharide export with SLBB domain